MNWYMMMSRPAGARGLKHICNNQFDIKRQVAPRRGAWIETMPMKSSASALRVAPRRGAWIETCLYLIPCALFWSRPAGARGLKLVYS